MTYTISFPDCLIIPSFAGQVAFHLVISSSIWSKLPPLIENLRKMNDTEAQPEANVSSNQGEKNIWGKGGVPLSLPLHLRPY